MFAAQSSSATEEKYSKDYQATKRPADYSIGMGVSMMSIPDYIGSDQSQFYIVPTPYVFYESDTVVIDRSVFEGNLFNQKNWHLTLDASGSIPVDSDDNEARKGMDDLNWVGELGPSLEYYFVGDNRSQNRTYLDFSIRKAINTDFRKISDTGWTGQFSLNNKYQFRSGVARGETIVDSSIALLFHSDKYAQYFYAIPTDKATITREAYNAQGGYAGARLSLGATWKREHIWIGLFSRYTYLGNASFENSPLVRSNNNLLVGISIAYIFLNSDY
ncbi:MipA/OmpV family protein [Colwellia sp. E2M01]|uniref:MipA/OmpV family protein n=1 Tax=Colwellia sp. E2M01 TaxID=2841561 RepID=UPI001C08DC6E|nr:MipA/OmpV family protein [Colwellia sp. E2M01]MBU2871638.1 MipA/OmpV family protein [Colwellia sp. E2M01]